MTAGLGGQQIGARRLAGAADAAPQIDLPAQVEGGLEQIAGGAARHVGAGLAAAGPGAVAELGEEFGTGDAQIGGVFVHAGGGDAQIAVVLQRLRDQGVEHRIAEGAPPVRIGDGLGFRDRHAPAFRRVDVGAHVVGAHRAAGGEGDEQRQQGAADHELRSGAAPKRSLARMIR